jgi:hypothetical protein
MKTQSIPVITKQWQAVVLVPLLMLAFISSDYACGEPSQHYSFAFSALTNVRCKGQKESCSEKSLDDSFEAGRNVVLVRKEGTCIARITGSCTYCDPYGLHEGSQLTVAEGCQEGFNIAVVGVDRMAVHLVSFEEDKSPLPENIESEARRLLSASLEGFDYSKERKIWLRKVLNDAPKVFRVEHGILLLFMKAESTLTNYMYDKEHRRWVAKTWESEEPVLVVNNNVMPLPATKNHVFFSVNERLYLVCTLLHPRYSHSSRYVYDLSSGTVTMVYNEWQKRKAARRIKTDPGDGEHRQDDAGTGSALKTLKGKLLSSSPPALEIEVTENGSKEVILVNVGLKTEFIPFRRPAVNEMLEVQYKEENGRKFGHVVRVIGP